jgi:hypothetical protein
MKLNSTQSSEKLIALGVCVFSFACLIPIIIHRGLWQGQEIWILEAIKSVHRSFHLAPRLGGNLIFDHNPVSILLFSIIPGDNIIFFRILPLVLGLILASAVFVYCRLLWDMWAGFGAGLITASSFGFLVAYSSMNMEVIPCTFAALSFMIFSLAYLRSLSDKWYVSSYVLAAIAFVTGGWIPLSFVFFGIVILILFDLSLERFFEIRALKGFVFFIGAWIAFYIIFRFAGGASFVSRALSNGSDLGFFASLWIFIKATLPWLPLLIPAWVYEIDPEGDGAWKSLLPAKIGFGLTFLILWLSKLTEPGYAIFAVPFMGILIGYWVSSKMKGFFPKIKTWAIIFSGMIIFVAGLFSIINLEWSMIAYKGISLAALIILGGLIMWFVRKDRLSLAVAIEIAVVFVVIISCSVILFPYKEKNNPLEYMSSIALSDKAYLVFEDDLHMRGYLAHAGAKPPILVDKKFRPLGDDYSLAVSAQDMDELVDGLEDRMNVEVKSSFESDRNYALLTVSPKNAGD